MSAFFVLDLACARELHATINIINKESDKCECYRTANPWCIHDDWRILPLYAIIP